MSSYEYKVVTAPSKGRRGRGVKGPDGRFAFSLELLMNEMAAEGWEYQRAETLPSEERSGLSSTQTVYRNVLIFRRKRAGDMSAYDPRLIEGPEAGTILLPPAAPDEDGQGESDESLAGMLRRRASRLMTGSARDDAHAYEDEDGLAASDSNAAASLADRFARIDEEETVAAEADTPAPDAQADQGDASAEADGAAADAQDAATDAEDPQDDEVSKQPGRGPVAGNGPLSHRAAAE